MQSGSPAKLREVVEDDASSRRSTVSKFECGNELCLLTGTCWGNGVDCPHAGTGGKAHAASVSIALPGYVPDVLDTPVAQPLAHPYWVRICHWVAAGNCLVLALTGFLILMVHPRLY